MKTVLVKTDSKTYEVFMEPGLLERAGELAARVIRPGRAAVVADGHVAPLYGERLSASLRQAGFSPVLYVFPPGESSKNMGVLTDLLNFLAKSGLTRSDTVFALGGGVTGDLAGLAAALYLRGINLVQLPTTLLAAVDSSVGGKTAVDLDAGKNLAGAFYQPDLVLFDPGTLKTLPEEEFSGGCAEVIKYAMIRDFSLLEALADREKLTDVIARCVEIKRDVVAGDERDRGERQILNFGHTFGHAIEAVSGYAVSHGRAVAMGMALMTRAAAKKGLCPPECLSILLRALKQQSLPSGTDYPEEALYSAMLGDKKRASGKITLIVPKEPGVCARLETTLEEARVFLRLGLEETP